jgi:hypothetical protein
MNKRALHRLKNILIILTVSLLTTLGSYAIVTKRNVVLDPLKEYDTLSGKTIVNLPCAAVGGPPWMSSHPILPEARGLPLNYHFWNPCYGNQILLDGFVFDLVFWVFIYSALYIAYEKYKDKSQKGPTTPA